MKLIMTLLLILTSQNLLAHGEDKMGPNGGYIRMPGAFHTEVVPLGKSKAKIYLLDINWKNPITAKSSVTVEVASKKNSSKNACAAKENYFECDVELKEGKLTVNADRSGQVGKAIYDLPLTLPKKVESGHGQHH